MLIIGLTGSIGMGKSAAAGFLRDCGIPVFDSDAEVHRLYAAEAAPLIEAAFPGTTRGGEVDRTLLSQALMGDPSGFRRLEAIVHPLVRAGQRRFLADGMSAGEPLAVLEIPLLFETGGERLVDLTVVVSAPAELQRQRVLERPGMTAEKLEAILSRQIGDAEKRRRADFVVDTSGTLDETRAQIESIVADLKGRRGSAYERCWT
ncbi:MAG: dephospho-CoA kinase [Hyphomicrobiaceae bacterium]